MLDSGIQLPEVLISSTAVQKVYKKVGFIIFFLMIQVIQRKLEQENSIKKQLKMHLKSPQQGAH